MHTQRRDQLGRYITFKAETQIYLLRLVASLKERIPCRLPSGKRPNGLLRNVEGIAGWGGRVPRRKSGRLHLDYLARYTMEGPAWHLSSPLPLHLHLRHVFSRRLMRPNAGVHASPRVPVNAHGISYLTDEDIYDNPRTGHPTHSLSPVPWTKTYDVTLPPPSPHSFLPYPSPLLYWREFCRFFSIPDMRGWVWVVSKFALFWGKKGICRLRNGSKRAIVIQARIYHFSFRLVSF